MTPWTVRSERARDRHACVRCGDPHDGETATCRTCIVDLVNATDDVRTERQAAGLCRCARQIEGPYRLCPRCRGWARETMAAKRRAPKPCP